METRAVVSDSRSSALRPALYIVAVTRLLSLEEGIGSTIILFGCAEDRSDVIIRQMLLADGKTLALSWLPS